MKYVSKIHSNSSRSCSCKVEFARMHKYFYNANLREERWEGQRISPIFAKDHYGVDSAYCLSDFSKYMEKHTQDHLIQNSNSGGIALWYDFNNPTNDNIHNAVQRITKHAEEMYQDRCVVQSPRNKELRHLKVHDELKGIGVRIEDDILITEKLSQRNDGKPVKELSCEVLSSGCPKTISDLESLPL